ncbi:sulfotransferase family 2 domain-containing protein [uncultured Bradyrhizobium sp.]|jgi:hypothetical protein|uniref:sulfotransferase family 2 domain-containing protein n=1 Tax=uncultured Bradyrhizobium sp. TaxID=199684 RepID=UPI0026061393|nr:sulfotransferase family 2 domain-containing protein [uncultured Bradyrhizobium sp.]
MSVYSFDDLLNRREPLAPPLVHVHVQKSAGSTLNGLLMKNYKMRVSSRGADFIPRYTREELITLAGPPRSEDDRVRPTFFTGHIDLDNEIFGLIPGRFVTVAVLRDPVERVISHYRFNSTQPGVFQRTINEEGMSVLDYHHKFAGAIGTQFGVFAPNGSVSDAVRRLEHEVSLFGLSSTFDEFTTALSSLLGFQTWVYKSLNRTSLDAAKVNSEDVSELRAILAEDVAFYEEAVALYERRKAHFPPFIAQHAWTKFYT